MAIEKPIWSQKMVNKEIYFTIVNCDLLQSWRTHDEIYDLSLTKIQMNHHTMCLNKSHTMTNAHRDNSQFSSIYFVSISFVVIFF